LRVILFRFRHAPRRAALAVVAPATSVGCQSLTAAFVSKHGVKVIYRHRGVSALWVWGG